MRGFWIAACALLLCLGLSVWLLPGVSAQESTHSAGEGDAEAAGTAPGAAPTRSLEERLEELGERAAAIEGRLAERNWFSQNGMTALTVVLGLVTFFVGITSTLNVMRMAQDRAAIERIRNRMETLTDRTAALNTELELKLDEVRDTLAALSGGCLRVRADEVTDGEVGAVAARLWERIRAAEELTRELAEVAGCGPGPSQASSPGAWADEVAKSARTRVRIRRE